MKTLAGLVVTCVFFFWLGANQAIANCPDAEGRGFETHECWEMSDCGLISECVEIQCTSGGIEACEPARDRVECNWFGCSFSSNCSC